MPTNDLVDGVLRPRRNRSNQKTASSPSMRTEIKWLTHLLREGYWQDWPRPLRNSTLGTKKAWPMVARQHLLQKVLHLRHLPLASARSAARYQSSTPSCHSGGSQGELVPVTAVFLYVQLHISDWRQPADPAMIAGSGSFHVYRGAIEIVLTGTQRLLRSRCYFPTVTLPCSVGPRSLDRSAWTGGLPADSAAAVPFNRPHDFSSNAG